MGKTTIFICENKGADQLRGNREADQCSVFATRIVQLLYFLNTKLLALTILCDWTARIATAWSGTTMLVFPRGSPFGNATVQLKFKYLLDFIVVF